MKAFVRLLAATILFQLALLGPLAAQELMPQPAPAETSAVKADAPEAPPPPKIPEALENPRATMATFLDAMNAIKETGEEDRIEEAMAALDLTAVNAIVREERGSDLVWMLLDVLDRTRTVTLEDIPEAPEKPYWVFEKYNSGVVKLVQQEDGRWLFGQETVAKLPKILDELSETERVVGDETDNAFMPWHIRFRQQLPEVFKQTAFVLENWHWIGLFVVILVGVVLDKILSFLLRFVVRHWRRHTRHAEFKDISDEMLRPLGLMAMAVIWLLGINLMGLPEGTMVILLVAVKALASISGVWAAYRLVDLVSAYFTKRAAATENKLDDALAPLIPRTLKIFVTVVGFLFVADNLNIDISSLLAGLGLGGLAFALAAKDMVQNLFGSVTVLLDQTFTVGDWIKVGAIEGTVERIGFRSTRIRTFYNSVVTVPNSTFITADVDNLGERRFRRLNCKVSLTYDTPPDRIEAFCEGVRELVRQHPYMRKDYFHIYFNEFAAASLEILVYVFWDTPDWATELRERHRFLLDVLRLGNRLKVEFAFPTQTLYMRQDDGALTDPPAETEQQEAFNMGRESARKIVAETTGAGVRPPPVIFPPTA